MYSCLMPAATLKQMAGPVGSAVAPRRPEEALEYLGFQMRQRRFDFTPSEKTVDLLTGLLEEFSLGQVFRMIWSGAVGAADYYQRGDVSRPQAANSAVTRIRTYAERARANG